eukprot:4935140-Amphidinium_carterae.2
MGPHVLEEITLESLDSDPTRQRLGVDNGVAASVIPRNMSTTQVVRDELAGRVFMTATREKVTDEGYQEIVGIVATSGCVASINH